MTPSEKLDILIELYIYGDIDREDYIRIRKEIEVAIERQNRKDEEISSK